MDNSIPNCYYRVSIKALIMNDFGSVLLIQEDNGMWELPGGGLDFGESPQEGIIRELQEELGINANRIDSKPQYFFTRFEDNKWKSNVIYPVRIDHLNFTPSSECIALKFFSKQEMLQEKNLFPNVRIFAELL